MEKDDYPPMDFTVRGMPNFNYSSEALMNIADKFDIFMPSFDPGPDEVSVINLRQASDVALQAASYSSEPTQDPNVF